MDPMRQEPAPTASLRDVVLLFFRLGATAFGGPAAHIAMMEEEIVRRRQWLSREEFLDLLGATNLIPGPNSTEMAIHIGHKMAGWRGLILGGAAFIIPAFLIVWAIAWFYVAFGELPAVQSVFSGVKPVILAVVAHALWSLSRSAVKDRLLGGLAVLALGLYLFWGNELKPRPTQLKTLILPLLGWMILFPTTRAWGDTTPPGRVSPELLFAYFAKVGSALFGSGYVLIAFLQSDLVDKYQWISQQQLIDAIAVGQFTPGPVFTTATFIGYLILGHSGAVVATLGIFLPAFVFVALSAPFIPALRRSRWTAPLLDGLNVASLSLMAGAAIALGQTTINNWYGALTFVLSSFLLIRFKVNSVWLILAAGTLGWLGLAG
jgi:chromate transporter